MPLKINYLFSAERDLELPVSHGVWVHRVFFRILEEKAPELGRQVHEDKEVSPFSLNFLRGVEHRRRRAFLPAGHEAIFSLRLLSPELEKLFSSLEEFEIELDGMSLRFKEAGFFQRSFEELVRSAQQVLFRFLSPTTFRRFGHNYPVPAPECVFSGLLRKWNRFAPKSLRFPEGVTENFQRELLISRYKLKTCMVEFGRYRLVAFKGETEFRTAQKELAGVLGSLSGLAFFAGVGYKTSMGLGETEVVFAGA